MQNENPVALIVIACFCASFVLSIRVACLKLNYFDRFSSFLSQVGIAVISLLPLMHGSPHEWFSVLILVICWSAFAFVSTWRLYRIPIITVKILVFSQFVEIVANLLLALFNYIDACWAWRGHFIWNP